MQFESVREQDRGATTIAFDRQWVQSAWRPLLITLLVGCLLTVASQILLEVGPGTFPLRGVNLLIAMGAGAAFTACLVGATAVLSDRHELRKLYMRLVEPVAWIVLFRLLSWGILGTMPSFSLLLFQPLEAIFDGLFVAGIILILLGWTIAHVMNGTFLAMALQPDEVSHITRAYGSLGDTVENTMRSDRRALLDRFTTLWIALGIILLVLATGVRVRPRAEGFVTILSTEFPPRVMMSMILYFFSGFLLMGQARLMTLRARWAMDGLAVEDRHFGAWNMRVLAFVGATAFAASVIPVGETTMLATILMFLINAIRVLAGMVLLAISTLLSLLFRRGGNESAGEAQNAPMEFIPPEEVLAEETGSGLPEFLLWILGGLILFLVIRQLLAARGASLAWFLARLREFLARLWTFCGLLLDNIDMAARQVMRVLTGQEPLGNRRPRRRGRRLPRNASPDEQVMYAYLETLDLASEQGVGRRQAETPMTYGPRLASYLEDQRTEETAEEERLDVEGLTDAFLKAKYAPAAVAPQEARAARGFLARIRSLFSR